MRLAAALLALLLAPPVAAALEGPPLPDRSLVLLDVYDRLHSAAEESPRASAGRDVADAGRPADGRLSWSLLREEAERLWWALHPALQAARERAQEPPGATGAPSWWLRIAAPVAACESGGSPGAVSSGGAYRGKWQFDLGTWASVGGSGDPAAAPEAEQDARAYALWQSRGWAPWPVCGRLALG